jgi:hypothetical protein
MVLVTSEMTIGVGAPSEFFYKLLPISHTTAQNNQMRTNSQQFLATLKHVL